MHLGDGLVDIEVHALRVQCTCRCARRPVPVSPLAARGLGGLGEPARPLPPAPAGRLADGLAVRGVPGTPWFLDARLGELQEALDLGALVKYVQSHAGVEAHDRLAIEWFRITCRVAADAQSGP